MSSEPLDEGVIVYITTRDVEEARRIGRAVVAERLAACANVVPGVESAYWWEGRLEEATEALLLLKTLPGAVEPLMQAVRRLHSYAVPAISVVPIRRGNPDYMRWMAQEIQAPPAPQATGPSAGRAGDPEVGLEGLLPYPQAVAVVEELVHSGRLPALGADTVRLDEALGRVLAREVTAPDDLPPVARAAMDGYAVRSADVANARPGSPAWLLLGETLVAGPAPSGRVEPGRCVRIMTGVPLPAGADAVVPQERARLDARAGQVGVEQPVSPGAYTFARGVEARAGETLVPAGVRLAPGHLALLASLGHARIEVVRRPRAVIFATGDEVVPVDAPSPLAPGQVRNSNGAGLMGQLTGWGAHAELGGILRDDRAAIRAGVAPFADAELWVFTGGISVGLRDLVRPALEELGARFSFHRVAIRPGRPVGFGVRANGLPFFALPGTPGGAMVAAELFIRPLLAWWMGRPWREPHVAAVLDGPVRSVPGRRRFLRARAWVDGSGAWRVRPVGHQSSASVRSLAEANALLVVSETAGELPAGAMAEVRLLGDDPAWGSNT